jgi:hypothetical protein
MYFHYDCGKIPIYFQVDMVFIQYVIFSIFRVSSGVCLVCYILHWFSYINMPYLIYYTTQQKTGHFFRKLIAYRFLAANYDCVLSFWFLR